MVDQLERLRVEIDALCRRHDVRRLELFGSAATGALGGDSVIDFLVDFALLGQGQCAEHIFGSHADRKALVLPTERLRRLACGEESMLPERHRAVPRTASFGEAVGRLSGIDPLSALRIRGSRRLIALRSVLIHGDATFDDQLALDLPQSLPPALSADLESLKG